jgi:hypothetical protein
MTELQNWLLIILTSAGVFGGTGWAILSFYFARSEATAIRVQSAKEESDKRLYKAEKDNVLNSIRALSDVVRDTRLAAKETNANVTSLNLSVRELQVQFGSMKEILEKYYRGPIIQTGDGTTLDPRKVVKQK